jgi:hypothetical protein
VPVMLPLHAPLHAERDQQPDRDRSQVNKKFAPAIHRFMRRMHIEHSLIVSLSCAVPPSLSKIIHHTLAYLNQLLTPARVHQSI